MNHFPTTSFFKTRRGLKPVDHERFFGPFTESAMSNRDQEGSLTGAREADFP